MLKPPVVVTTGREGLERNEEAMRPDPLPGYVWLETRAKVLHAPEHALEFTDQPLV